jgi:hypothetical protein
MMMIWPGNVARLGEKRTTLVRKPGITKPLGKPRRRVVDNIKMDLGEIGLGIDWTALVQDRDKRSAHDCGNELPVSIKCWEIIL